MPAHRHRRDHRVAGAAISPQPPRRRPWQRETPRSRRSRTPPAHRHHPHRQQLYSLAAQASRLCGWLCYDSGLHAAAQRYYLTALRASATAGDALTGANTLAFQAIQTYTVGNPHDAAALMHTARASIQGHSTPKTLAILHAREARALSKPNDHQRCDRALNAAFDALTTTCDHEPQWCY